jgi:hypothetical protein
MPFVETAVLSHLYSITIVLLVFGRYVVAPFALLASQGNLDPLLVLCHLYRLLF